MKVIANHVIETDRGAVGRFEELDDGRFLYLHHKLQPWIISKDIFEQLKEDKELPKKSNLT